MSFQALARTWRPRQFEDLVGQAHVVRALSYALDQNRLHHALLFSGTRGVGKTTLARIIAKCLNCEHGTTRTPCRAESENACESCREIDGGRFVDLIEVDAASRTGVDDTRALMDNVQYAPTRGRTKVYLIDEVHMLTKHSFNALLKTFEEPPPNVQFLLATTEPEKIPVTILSRCLQFPLKRLSPDRIAAHLGRIAEAESLAVESAALDELARAADGSVRDALSLLDQGLAFGGGRLTLDDTREMLGTVGASHIAALVDGVIDADAGAAMRALNALYENGTDTRYLLDALATAWQDIAAIQITGESFDADDSTWRDRAARAEPGAVQVFYDITLAGIRDLSFAPDPLVGTRMSILRMLAFTPAGDEAATDAAPSAMAEPAQDTAALVPPGPASSRADEPRDDAKNPPTLGPPGEAVSPAAHDDAQTTDTRSGQATAQATPAPQSASGPDFDAYPGPGVGDHDQPQPQSSTAAAGEVAEPRDVDWHALSARLNISGLAAQLAENAVCERLDSTQIVLALASAQSVLATDSAKARLESALAEAWPEATPPRLKIRTVDRVDDTPAQRSAAQSQQDQDEAVAAIENDPIVHKLKDRLGAQVRADTVKPYRPDQAKQ